MYWNDNFKPRKAQREWVEALESGKYRQARGTLWKIRSDGFTGYCCLGVAETMYHPKANKLLRPSTFNSKESYGGSLSNQTAELLFMATSGRIDGDHVRTKHGEKLMDKYGYSLTEFNDAGVQFKTIAKFIKENPWAVFTRDARGKTRGHTK